MGLAVAIALLAVALFEKMAAIAPVPPGGDEGTWLLLSYPYVGIPFPSQAAPLSYPPLAFPFLGLAVRFAGGPLGGARLFAGVVIGLSGLAVYDLGRALFRFRAVALLAEAAFLVQPDFQQLYYFGSYPNMFGLIFFFLALGYAVRFLRSRRPSHLAVFWVAMLAAVLSHALVAVFLLATVGVAAFILLLYQRLPRELIASKVGAVGATVFAAGAFAYYEGTVLLHINGPNYLSGGALTRSVSQALLPTVLKPLYLEKLSQVVNGSGFTQTQTLTLEIVWGVPIVLGLLTLILRFVRPRLMSYRVVILLSWVAGLFLVTLVTYYLGLSSDYRRFAYFLYPATVLGAALVGDVLLDRLVLPRVRLAPGRAPAGTTRDGEPPFRWRGWDRRRTAYAGITVGVAMLLLLSGVVYTAPKAQAFAVYFTRTGHDAGFVSAMSAIADSGIPGSILSSTESVDRWPATLTSRNVYEVRAPTGFTYSGDLLVEDELAYLAINYRYTVTNGLVAASIPGVSPSYFNSTPIYSIFTYGIQHEIVQLQPQSISVQLNGGAYVAVYSHGKSATPWVQLPSAPNGDSFALVYNGSGVQVTETVTAFPGAPTASIALRAVSTNGTNLTGLRAKIVSSGNQYNPPAATGPASFTWFTNTTNGNYTTDGAVVAPGVVQQVVAANASTGSGGSVTVQSNANGAPVNALGLNFSLTTPGASNTAGGITGFYSTPAVLGNWSTRFVLLWNGSTTAGPIPEAYYELEYGASVYYVNGPWTVLLLPTTLLGS